MKSNFTISLFCIVLMMGISSNFSNTSGQTSQNDANSGHDASELFEHAVSIQLDTVYQATIGLDYDEVDQNPDEIPELVGDWGDTYILDQPFEESGYLTVAYNKSNVRDFYDIPRVRANYWVNNTTKYGSDAWRATDGVYSTQVTSSSDLTEVFSIIKPYPVLLSFAIWDGTRLSGGYQFIVSFTPSDIPLQIANSQNDGGSGKDVPCLNSTHNMPISFGEVIDGQIGGTQFGADGYIDGCDEYQFGIEQTGYLTVNKSTYLVAGSVSNWPDLMSRDEYLAVDLLPVDSWSYYSEDKVNYLMNEHTEPLRNETFTIKIAYPSTYYFRIVASGGLEITYQFQLTFEPSSIPLEEDQGPYGAYYAGLLENQTNMTNTSQISTNNTVVENSKTLDLYFPDMVGFMFGVLFGVFLFGSVIKYRMVEAGLGSNLPKEIVQHISSVFGKLTPSYLIISQNFALDNDEMDILTSLDFPHELFQEKLLLNPVKLAIFKILMNHISISSAELRSSLGITWGRLSNHLKFLQDNGYIKLQDEFEKGNKKQTISIEPAGITKYNYIIELLKEYLQ